MKLNFSILLLFAFTVHATPEIPIITKIIEKANKLAKLEEEIQSQRNFWISGIYYFKDYYADHKEGIDLRLGDPEVYFSQSEDELKKTRKKFFKLSKFEKLVYSKNIFLQKKEIAELKKEVGHLRKKINKVIIADIIKGFHSGKYQLSHDSADFLFGVEYEQSEAAIPKGKYTNPEIWLGPSKRYTQTPYLAIKEILSSLSLKDQDVVYDLGSGYGRLLLYGGIMYPKVKFKGVEIVEERVKEVDLIVRSLQLNNVHVVANDVLEEDLSEASIFYLFNPFPSITDKVLTKLEQVSKKHTIRIIAAGDIKYKLQTQNWLKLQRDISTNWQPISIFVSQ